MACISTPDDGWVVARWVLRSYLGDVSRALPGDDVILQELSLAIDFDGLHLHRLGIDMRRRLLPVMIEVAKNILSGEVRSCIYDKWDDPDTPKMYQEGLRELVPMLERYAASPESQLEPDP